MKFINTLDKNEKVTFRQATLKGLAENKGLYVPESIPVLPASFFENIEQLSNEEIGVEVLKHFIGDELCHEELSAIVADTIHFPFPVKQVKEDIHVLELFHGPTMAFKDIGARFMARCLGKFAEVGKPVTVLVATSGDTGSAVAHGFFNVPNVKVKILFPDGKISPFQEYQMTSLGNNIEAIAVKGTFDDCQALVKQALQDVELRNKVQLSSANSINLARLLPQALYYFFAYKTLKPMLNGRELVFSVPSGNFGNLTAGLYAKRMGLPVHKFIASNNANDTFYRYQQTSLFEPKPSVETYSNAMDVGNPSNFDRILHLYNNDSLAIGSDVASATFTDEQTLQQMEETFSKHGYTLDPHGAVGMLGLNIILENHQTGLFLATASPAKFEEVVRKAIPTFPATAFEAKECYKLEMDNDYAQLVRVLA